MGRIVHVPTVELRRKFPPWFSRAVRELLREKERAHKLKKSHPSTVNISEHARVRSEFKKCSVLATVTICWDS